MYEGVSWVIGDDDRCEIATLEIRNELGDVCG